MNTPPTAETQPIQVVSFYKFIPMTEEQVHETYAQISAWEQLFKAQGLCIMGTEGLNATFAVPRENAQAFVDAIMTLTRELANDPNMEIFFKMSYCDKPPFHEFVVKIRKEIVTLGRPDIVPQERNHHHLSPEEWHKVMTEEDVVVIDTRNSYEYEIGRFKNAIDPKTRNFTGFPDWVKTELPKHMKKPDQKVLIYCTGGIRCEKAIYEMEAQGYENVYQLDGGILHYMEKFKNSDVIPDSQWDGECFVFDYRVAVDGELKPSQTYRLCPHCGQPAKTPITCVQCGVEDIVCDHCLEKGQTEEVARGRTADVAYAKNQFHTCSKNCAHHFRMGHQTKRIHLDSFKMRKITPSLTTTS